MPQKLASSTVVVPRPTTRRNNRCADIAVSSGVTTSRIRTRTSGSPIVNTEPKAGHANQGAFPPDNPGTAVNQRCHAPARPHGAGASQVDVALPEP